MNGVLVDSSVWIDYFGGNTWSSRESDMLDDLIHNTDIEIYICPQVYQEFLQGIRDDYEFETMKNAIADFTMLEFDTLEIYNTAIDLYRSLRKKGITIRKPNDCLIASYGMLANVPVLFKDRDFHFICDNTSLQKYTT